MAEIIRPDFMTKTDLEPNQVLDKQKDLFEHVFVVGVKEGGEVVIAASSGDVLFNLGLLSVASFKLNVLNDLEDGD